MSMSSMLAPDHEDVVRYMNITSHDPEVARVRTHLNEAISRIMRNPESNNNATILDMTNAFLNLSMLMDQQDTKIANLDIRLGMTQAQSRPVQSQSQSFLHTTRYLLSLYISAEKARNETSRDFCLLFEGN